MYQTDYRDEDALVLRRLGGVVREKLREVRAQLLLVDLACTTQRQLIDENDLVRQPPLGDPVQQMLQDFFSGSAAALFQLNEKQRSFAPFGMMHSDYSGHRRVFVRKDGPFQLL